MTIWPFARHESPTDGYRGQALVEFALVTPLLFLLLIGIFEAGRFILYQEMLNNATREGARYAIVHGANSSCPSGPWPDDLGLQPSTSVCDGNPQAYDETGANIIGRIEESSAGLLSAGELTIGAPVWTQPSDWTVPGRDALDDAAEGGNGNGDNDRGSHVTVFADFAYDTIIGMLFETDLLPQIQISTESTLVINN